MTLETEVKQHVESDVDHIEDNLASCHNDPSGPPNGGIKAWMQVAGSFFLFLNTWGIVNTFGVFQTYYSMNPYWQASPSDISWIGSIQSFILLFFGVISGPIYDAGYFKSLVITGSFLVTFGLMMTSLCRTYWQTMLAQGVVVGLGTAALYIPSVAILPQYFSTKKVLANGIAASGSGLGGIIYPIMFSRLEADIGFPWATRALAFVAFAGLLFSNLVMEPRKIPIVKRPLIQWRAFQEPPYLLFCIGIFFAFLGFFPPFYYLETFAYLKHYGSPELDFYLLPILCAASIPGVILPNLIGDYVGPLNVMLVFSMLTGAISLAWIGVRNLGGLMVFTILYGFVSGAFVSLPAVAVVTLTKDMRDVGTRIGQLFCLSSLGLLIGAPVSGQIFSATGGFLGLQLFSGFSLVIATVFCAGARFMVSGWALKGWA